MTGVHRSFAGDLSREQIIQEVLRYARTAVPDALRFLVNDDGIVRAIAESKLRQMFEI